MVSVSQIEMTIAVQNTRRWEIARGEVFWLQTITVLPSN